MGILLYYQKGYVVQGICENMFFHVCALFPVIDIFVKSLHRENSMKRIVTLALAGALLFCAAVASAADTARLTMATGGTSGVYYPLGGAISQVLTSKSGGTISVTPQATGASGENMRLTHAGDVQLAILQNDVADAAFKGVEPYKQEFSNVRAIARLYPEYLHVVASENSGIKTIADFKGKKISVGARGSGNEVNCRQLFKFFGLDYKNIQPIFLPYGETADQFKDRALDAFVFTIGTPNPAVQDITTSQKVNFVPLAGKEVDEIVKTYPYLVKDQIPAKTYNGQDSAVPTLAVQAMLVVNKDLPEALVYQITKLLFENIGDVAKAHNKGAEITLQHAADGVTIPFHPGAEKYLREKGILK